MTAPALVRLPDWEVRLHIFLSGTVPVFAWHELDCARFGAGVVEAVTGTDLFAPFRGHYRTAIGSVRALRRHGAGTLEATVDAVLPRIAPGFARRGDLVMVPSDAGGMVGVCVGSAALFVGEDSWVRHERADGRWSSAWSVG